MKPRTGEFGLDLPQKLSFDVNYEFLERMVVPSAASALRTWCHLSELPELRHRFIPSRQMEREPDLKMTRFE